MEVEPTNLSQSVSQFQSNCILTSSLFNMAAFEVALSKKPRPLKPLLLMKTKHILLSSDCLRSRKKRLQSSNQANNSTLKPPWSHHHLSWGRSASSKPISSARSRTTQQPVRSRGGPTQIPTPSSKLMAWQGEQLSLPHGWTREEYSGLYLHQDYYYVWCRDTGQNITKYFLHFSPGIRTWNRFALNCFFGHRVIPRRRGI